MDSASKYLASLTIHRREAVNNQASGGFPHSEIPGSKGALASPGLIAECHVLHRLLSPRHPPNALLALDPVRKTNDALLSEAWFSLNVVHVPSAGSHLFPARRDGLRQRCGRSVLDLERLFLVSYRFAA